MKKILLFILLVSSPAFAQPAKVLICAPGNLNAAKTTDSSVRKFYSDSIDLSDTLTDDINKYEAVFLLLSRQHPLTQEGGILLKEYLHTNKKICIQGLFNGELPFTDDLDNNPDGFCKFINFSGEYFFDGVELVDHIVGKNGAFTERMNLPNNNYAYQIPYIHSSAIPVLYAVSQQSNDIFSIADIYETDSFKIVLYYPPITFNDEVFLNRVLCDYFGLCTPLSVEERAENSKPAYSVFPNPVSDKFIVLQNSQNSDLQSVDLFSEKGELVSRWSALQQEDRYEFNLHSLHLTSGTYFLRLQNNKESIVQPILLLSK